ncbi:hypothetical protein K32_33780 [Kaistia sp. 32K]|uniref:DUF2207 domain-containing protein n=1 Tax=Kaistia sp. 32K TaxID=2795690 RepID=UPI001915C9A9|nr:DUF2207 domain-containing protein [Kaistia sp. 32K]BCP54761.1 hypothetical protein K32_33780 [Kaistia sp. 32K]
MRADRLRATCLGLAAGLLLAFAPLAAGAEERILRFVSDVTVERNGDLEVVETIRVQAEGNEIRRGILRDFPTTYRDDRGGSVVVGFDVESVTRDGQNEPFAIETLSNGKRIRIGSAETLLTPGPHDYVIRYRTNRQIGFFDDFDELYWNVTGTGWTFPIDVAEARITLPEAVPFGNTAIYTGQQGERGQDARVVSKEPGRIVFRTTAPLPAHNGLTVAAAWPKGVVAAPSSGQRTYWWLRDNIGPVFALFGAAGGLLYLFQAWRKAGRDPKPGPIIPLFTPPEGLSAAATRYISEMNFDDRAFTAAILDLGVKGQLKIADSGKALALTRTPGGKPAGPAEMAAAQVLFGSGGEIRLVQSNHMTLSSAEATLARGLAKAYSGTVFNMNSGWLTGGVLITLAAYILAGIGLVSTMGENGLVAAFSLVFLSIPAIVVGLTLRSLRGSPWYKRIFALLFTGIFALAFGGAGLGVFLSAARGPLDFAVLLLPFALLPVLASAFSWMRSPTPEGQKLRDAVAGFRQYLGIAEEHRLEILHPPEKTPELFERYLPYAVALDVENAWAKKFAGVLAAAGATAAVSSWYLANNNRSATDLVDRLGSGLSQTVASASTAPGSSSGSGGFSSGSSGGGSSGGGGGGGGGSGW